MAIKIHIASVKHIDYAPEVCKLIAHAAKQRGTGIAKRDPEYIKSKMRDGKGVIALDGSQVVGFCYIETWEDKKYVANSGLIVHPDYRGQGLASKIKKAAFELSKKIYPGVRLFGITTSLAVMRINSSLGYVPVTFSELTQDEAFWKGCQSCPNYDILQRNNRSNCLCTGMLYDPNKDQVKNGERRKRLELYHRWVRLKKISFFSKSNRKKS